MVHLFDRRNEERQKQRSHRRAVTRILRIVLRSFSFTIKERLRRSVYTEYFNAKYNSHTQTHSKERIIDHHHHHHGRRRPQQNRLRRRQKNEIRDVERGEHHLHVRWYGDKRRFTERAVRVRVRKTIRDSAKSGFANHERERCHRASAIGHRENEHDFLVLVSNGRYNAKRSASFGVIPDERISGTNRENSVGARELHERSSARMHWWTFYRRRHSKIRLRRAHSFRDAGESLRYD